MEIIRPVDNGIAYGFGYGQLYPPALAHLTLDGLHHGQDILAPIGSIVYSPCDAILNEAGQSDITPLSYYGRHIIAKFQVGDTLYRFITMHLSRTFLGRVNVGDKIAANQVIGLTGDTGSAAGHPHLHFEIQQFVNNEWTPVDPAFVIGNA